MRVGPVLDLLLDYLAPLVETAVDADAMRVLRLLALWAGGKVHGFDLHVVGATPVTTALRMSSFWNSHVKLLSKKSRFFT